MTAEELAPGVHGTKAEIEYARHIYYLLRDGAGYEGKIEVVGPRVNGERVNLGVLVGCLEEPAEEVRRVFDAVNREVVQLDLSAKEIPEAKDFLPNEITARLGDFFTAWGEMGSRLVMVVGCKLPPWFVDREWVDEDSGLNVLVVERPGTELRKYII